MSVASETGLPEGAELMSDGSGRVRYPLRYPISFKVGGVDQKLEEIIVRRKNFEDNLTIKAMTNEVDIGFTLFMRLTGIEEPIARKLDDVDQMAFGQIVESFTKPGPKMPMSAPVT